MVVLPVITPVQLSVAVGGVTVFSIHNSCIDVRTVVSATGEIVSSTVTTAVHVSLFPLLSVTVSTTLFAPMFVQSKVEISIALVAIPQASVLPLSTSAAVIVALPVASNCEERLLGNACGNR